MSIPRDIETYDLIIVGAGSGNMIPGLEMESWRIAIVEPHKFGGTCLNRGSAAWSPTDLRVDLDKPAQDKGQGNRPDGDECYPNLPVSWLFGIYLGALPMFLK